MKFVFRDRSDPSRSSFPTSHLSGRLPPSGNVEIFTGDEELKADRALIEHSRDRPE